MSLRDPAEAFDFWKTLEPGRLDANAAILAIFPNYAKISPAGALALAKAGFKGPELEYACYTIATGTHDPATRIEIAGEITRLSDRGVILSGALLQWLEADRPAALAKLKSLDPRDLQAALQQGIGHPDGLAAKLASSDPGTLVTLLDAVVASKSSEALFEMAIERLVASDPAQALALLESGQTAN